MFESFFEIRLETDIGKSNSNFFLVLFYFDCWFGCICVEVRIDDFFLCKCFYIVKNV